EPAASGDEAGNLLHARRGARGVTVHPTADEGETLNAEKILAEPRTPHGGSVPAGERACRDSSRSTPQTPKTGEPLTDRHRPRKRAARREQEMTVRPILTLELLALLILVTSALYTHYRGRDRLKFRRQVTDHSTFLAPYNSLVYLFSGVPQTPLLSVDDFPQLLGLRNHWRTIRDEALRLNEQGYIRAPDRHDDLGFNTFFRKGWKRFYLKWYGDPLPSAQSLCPRTVDLLGSIPSVHGAMFALM